MKTKYSLARSIPRELLAAHAEVSSWKSVLLIFVVYLAAYAAVYLALRFPSALSWVATLLFVAGLQHHLITLMHEGAHHCLHPNKTTNDFLAQALCAFPLGMQLKDYRFFHLQHHKYSGNPEKDPEVRFYHATKIGYGLRAERVRGTLLSDITGSATLRSLIFLRNFTREKINSGELRALRLPDLVQGLAGVLMVVMLPWLASFLLPFIGVWIAAMVLVTPVLVRWHGLGEHTGENAEQEHQKTLTHHFSPLTNFFLYPISSGYHLEHHLFPQIPWYEVPRLRKKLLQFEHYNSAAEELSVDGYWWGKKSVRSTVLERILIS